MGYCMGVNRAVEAVRRALAENPLRPVYTYGPLIHNPAALDQLKKLGVEILQPSPLPEDFGGRSVVIRAHGIPPAEMADLAGRGADIVDATCPRVLSSQRRAERFYKAGIPVILAGDKNHGEITGIAGFAPGCTVLENREDAGRFVRAGNLPVKAALIGQTTIRQSEYDGIAEVLSAAIPELEVCPTICPAAKERQEALVRLAGQTEGILVVGGRNSANTRRLFSTAQALTGRAWLIERPEEIPAEVFTLRCVGITAGASTPEEIIASVERTLAGSGTVSA